MQTNCDKIYHKFKKTLKAFKSPKCTIKELLPNNHLRIYETSDNKYIADTFDEVEFVLDQIKKSNRKLRCELNDDEMVYGYDGCSFDKTFFFDKEHNKITYWLKGMSLIIEEDL